MKNQQGAALVIVMALLSGALLIGTSGMNSALIDERLAGNYRATALAQMNAERAISQAVKEFYEGKRASELSWTKPPLTSMDEVGDIFDDTENDASWCGSYNRCAYEFLVIDGVYSIVAKGRVVEESTGKVISESSFVIIKFDVSYNPPPAEPPPNNSYPTEQDVADLLNKILTSGNLVNVLNDYSFSGSQNQQSQDWINNISSDSSLFETASDACLFRDALLNGDIANGLVKELSGNVKKDDLSNASGKIAVVKEDDFSLPNASEFTGVLMIFGEDFQIRGGGNVDFNGTIIHVPVDCANGNFYTPQIDIRGGNGNYNLSAIESIINQLDIDDEDDDPDGSGGVVSSNNDLQVDDWEWSFD